MSFSKKPMKKSEEITNFIHEPITGSNEYKNIDKKTIFFPWDDFKKNSKKRNVFNLRINNFYESAYKYFSKKHKYESYQLFIRGIIEKALDEMIQKEINTNTNTNTNTK